ncbi:MAG TPA: hypothetical protein VFV38_40170, partial [Ktedonobacteraceae bacterium]|nr:hypothetical protein [Ktedonobacteraceae bacterium]
ECQDLVLDRRTGDQLLINHVDLLLLIPLDAMPLNARPWEQSAWNVSILFTWVGHTFLSFHRFKLVVVSSREAGVQLVPF